MKVLSGDEEKEAIIYMKKAAELAAKSLCLDRKCGSVIVKNNKIIGEGYNAPPLDKKLSCCSSDKRPAGFKSDKTCCIHAEQRAIIDAFKKKHNLNGSRLYFIRLDENGEMSRSKKPWCTACSKMALDAGVSEFVLWHDEGITVYGTKEYNDVSFQYRP